MLPSLPTFPPFQGNITLEYAASLVRRGRIRCKRHNKFTCSRPSSTFLPTRLVRISQEGVPLRLVESIAASGPYATLSYCWGAVKPPSTTRTNLSAMLHSIPEHILPVVFHQAIQLARTLGILYIWIDSLCIIQDSIEDWEAESARMSLYYKNGSINIAAATSDNPDIPFFKHVDDVWCPTTINAHDLQGTPSLINIKRLPTPNRSNRDMGALFTRAWTFQESLFAPRTIYFTSQGVFWTCSGGVPLSDNYVDPLTDITLCPYPMRIALARSSDTSVGGSEGSLLEDWRSLVAHYSIRLLTFPTDKFAAISGAAAEFYEYFHCPYLAGHWYTGLPQSLIWRAWPGVPSPGLGPLPREYVAPSWSWASLTSGIFYTWSHVDTTMVGMISCAAKLVDVQCKVPGRNPYGRVSSGFIDLRGRTAPVEIVREGGHLKTTVETDWNFHPDCELKMSENSLSRAMVGELVSDFAATTPCLYMASLNETDNSTKLAAHPRVTHYALVLGKPDREQTSFIRVGLLSSTSERGMRLFDGAVEEIVRIV